MRSDDEDDEITIDDVDLERISDEELKITLTGTDANGETVKLEHIVTREEAAEFADKLGANLDGLDAGPIQIFSSRIH